MFDYNRVYGGRRHGRRSPPLSLHDQPGKAQLIEVGHYSNKKRKKTNAPSTAATPNYGFCARRYSEVLGIPSSTGYSRPPILVRARPLFVYEVEGVCSCTDFAEAQATALVCGKQVLVYKR